MLRPGNSEPAETPIAAIGDRPRRRGQMRSSAQSERTWAALCHLAAFAGFVFPAGNIVGPLVIWLLRREESPLVDDQGKAAMNFQISTTLYFAAIVAGMLLAMIAFAVGMMGAPFVGVAPGAFLPAPIAVALLGALGLLALAVFNFIAVIVAAARTSSGERFRYPLSIGFIR
jgi:uncharacterized protein